jgi:hypothetical protein
VGGRKATVTTSTNQKFYCDIDSTIWRKFKSTAENNVSQHLAAVKEIVKYPVLLVGIHQKLKGPRLPLLFLPREMTSEPKLDRVFLPRLPHIILSK